MSSVLVTGGTGFIGQPLVRALVRQGDEVVVLTRDVAGQDAAAGVRYIGSLDDIAADTPIDAIVNLAGEPLSAGRWNDRRKAQFVGSRVAMTRDLCDLIDRLDDTPKTLLNGSAIGW